MLNRGVKLLMVCHYPDNFADHKNCDCGDVFITRLRVVTCPERYVILWVDHPQGKSPPCYVSWPMVKIFQDRIFNLSRDFIVFHHPVTFDGHRYCGSIDVFSLSRARY